MTRHHSIFQQYRSLVAMMAPGVFFGVFLLVLSSFHNYSWLVKVNQWPWEFWVVAAAGIVATIGGIADWRFHRREEVKMGSKEREAEFSALAFGGIPLFVLMIFATLIDNPLVLLIPVIVVVLYTVVMICYDEFVFHRKRCGRYETFLHRLLVMGNGIAWLAWAHLCFVRGGLDAVVV